MSGTSIQPHRFTSPIQVVAAFLAALVLVEAAVVGAVAAMDNAAWVRGFLAVAAILLVPVFIGAPFLLLTKFRPQIQQDFYYAQWLARTAPAFRDFSPENVEATGTGSARAAPSETRGDGEARRRSTYKNNRGLFLVHTWRPSIQEGQVADIVIELHQHTYPGGEAPLHQGLIERVEYELGPMFFDDTVLKTNSEENFRLEVSAYSPMLCLARVHFKDGSDAIDLDRYVDFPAP